MSKPVLKVDKSEVQVRREQRQSKLAIIAGKKEKGQLKLEDIDEKLDLVLEMLEELLRK